VDRNLSGGGAAVDIGVHVLDLVYWLLGPEPVSVTATAHALLARREDTPSNWGDWDRKRFDVEDFAAGFVRFANGATLTLEASWLAFQPEKELIRVQCLGTRAGLVWPDGVVVGETNRVPWELRMSETPQASAHHDEILHFARAVRDGLPSPVPVAETLNVIRVLEGLYGPRSRAVRSYWRRQPWNGRSRLRRRNCTRRPDRGGRFSSAVEVPRPMKIGRHSAATGTA
jgi:predicted dehydrogenase